MDAQLLMCRVARKPIRQNLNNRAVMQGWRVNLSPGFGTKWYSGQSAQILARNLNLVHSKTRYDTF